MKKNILLYNGLPWISGKGNDFPHEIIVDMKTHQEMSGFIYTPFWAPGHILQYDFFVGSREKKVNTLIYSGAFPDIANMPVQQVIRFTAPVTARYFKFVANASAAGRIFASIGKMEIISSLKQTVMKRFVFQPVCTSMESLQRLSTIMDKGRQTAIISMIQRSGTSFSRTTGICQTLIRHMARCRQMRI